MKWICNKKTAEIGKSLAAIGLALVIGALFILLAGESPIRAYTSLIQGALGTPQSIANTISKSIPLAFTGLAVAMGSRCGMLNIGAEGQLHAGAMASVITALTLGSLPAPILLVVRNPGRNGSGKRARDFQGQVQYKRGNRGHHAQLYLYPVHLLSGQWSF